jgi:hypothetical protein
MKKTNLSICGLLILASSSMALADSSAAAPAGSSETSSASTWDRVADHTALTYFGIYRGGSVNDPGNSLQPRIDGSPDPTSPQSLESYITTGYRFDKDMYVGVVTHFFYFPVGNLSDPKAGTGMDAQMLDPALVFSKAKLVDNGNGLTIKGLITATLPLTSPDILRTQGLATGISPTMVLSWDVPKTKLNLGLYGYVTGYVPSATAAANARMYKIYAAPNGSYSLTKTVSATMWVDLIQATNTADKPFISGMSNYTADIEPGISWDITPKLTINPMLNIYPGNPTLAATSFQAVIIGKAF